jgi:hypothetical protein
MSSDNEMIISEENAGGALPEFFNRVNQAGTLFSWKFLSVDLTSATDTFCQGICQSLALGVADSCRVLYAWRKLRILARNVSSLSEISYPDGSTIIQERGILMGTPESWGLLNLYNKFFTILAETVYENGGIPSGVTLMWQNPVLQESLRSLNRQSLCITKRCGDDQVIYGPPQVLTYYTDLITMSGAIPSPGTNAISEEYITFTQSLARFHKGKLDWIDIIRIISLVDWKGLNRLPSLKEVPRIWFRGLSVYLALRWWNLNEWELAVRKGLYIFAQYLSADFLQKAARSGAEPFLPSNLGGLGFPHPAGRELSHCATRTVRVISYLLRDDQIPETFYERTLLNVWLMSNSPSPSWQRVMDLEKVVFYRFFCPNHRAKTWESFLSDDPGKFYWIDLNQLRNLFEVSLPLTAMNYKFLQGIIRERSLLMKPIGFVWKEMVEAVRSHFSLDYSSEGIMTNTSFKFSGRVKMFRQKRDSLFKKTSQMKLDVENWRTMSSEDLQSRLTWADSYIWCSPSAWKLEIQRLLREGDGRWRDAILSVPVPTVQKKIDPFMAVASKKSFSQLV